MAPNLQPVEHICQILDRWAQHQMSFGGMLYQRTSRLQTHVELELKLHCKCSHTSHLTDIQYFNFDMPLERIKTRGKARLHGLQSAWKYIPKCVWGWYEVSAASIAKSSGDLTMLCICIFRKKKKRSVSPQQLSKETHSDATKTEFYTKKNTTLEYIHLISLRQLQPYIRFR